MSDDHDATADALMERLFGATLASLDAYSVYMGDALGYYRALASGALTSGELADRAGVHERYAREWLEQQAVTGILEVDDVTAAPGERRYSLPPGHTEVLLDANSMRYLTPIVRMLTVAGMQMDAIERAHRTGSGVGWSDYGDGMRVSQAEANKPAFMGWLGQEAFPSVPDLHARLAAGGRVADIGCGFGWSSIALALAYPGITVDGFDVDDPSIEQARKNAAEAGVADRVRFHARDAGDPGVEAGFDVVLAFECIHDLPRPVEVLAAMRRLRADDGIVVVMDERVAETFTAPGDEIERLMYGYSIMVCLNDGMDHADSAGTGTVMRPDTFRGYAQAAGFGDIEILPIEHDFWRFYRLIG